MQSAPSCSNSSSSDAELRKKISTLCCPTYTPDAENDFFDTGSFFVFAGESSSQRKLISQVKSHCSDEPLVATDLEYGAGRMIHDATKFASLFAAARSGPQLVEEMGRVAAEEGRSVGFNWTFGPCVDPLFDIDCPTLSVRSPGRSAEEAIATGLAYMRGLQTHGMLATAKHFPGDGYCRYDQHLTTAENPLEMDKWWATYGKIYTALIEADVAAIMPGHISLPAWDTPHPSNGVCPPATLSARLMKDLLRKKLGFQGLIVSDAVNMGGFSGFMNYHDACATFLESGGNVLLFAHPTEEFLDEMLQRIHSGMLSETAIDDSLARFKKFKERGFASQRVSSEASELNSAKAIATARQIAKSGLQLLRDRKHYLPVQEPETKRLLHVRLAFSHSTMLPIIDQFNEALSKTFAQVEYLNDPGPDAMRKRVTRDDCDLIIVSILNEYGYGTNHIHLAGVVARNMMGGWMHRGKPVIFISHAHPYLHWEYKAPMDCVIRTCGTTPETIPELIDLIAGKGAAIVPDEPEIHWH
ncbi:MAG: glycoside hydrolase family 3 protein [Chthoniobacterales bacterium]